MIRERWLAAGRVHRAHKLEHHAGRRPAAEQVASQSRETIIPRPVLDRTAYQRRPLVRRPWCAVRLAYMDALEQPLRRCGKRHVVGARAELPRIATSARVQGRRCDNESAITTQVDPRREAGAVPDGLVDGDVDMQPTTASARPWRVRDQAMAMLEIGEAGIPTVAWVDVEHQEPTAGGDPDVRRRPCPPPAPHGGLVRRRSRRPRRESWHLARAREYAPAMPHVPECRLLGVHHRPRPSDASIGALVSVT